MDPRSPFEAVTHRDPYPYYAALVAERPFGRDAESHAAPNVRIPDLGITASRGSRGVA